MRVQSVRLKALAAAVGCLLSGAAQAQAPLAIGDVVQGAITRDDPPAYKQLALDPAASQMRWDCYQLMIPTDQAIRIRLTTRDDSKVATVGSGDCQATLDHRSSLPLRHFGPANDDRVHYVYRNKDYDLTLAAGFYSVAVMRLFIDPPRQPVEYQLSVSARGAPSKILSLRAPGSDGAFKMQWFGPLSSASTSDGGPETTAGQAFRDCPTCPELVTISAGTVLMGSSATVPDARADESPRHLVTFAKPFALSRNEISFEEWNACVLEAGCRHKPSDQGWGQGRRPVVDVSWTDAMGYVDWLSRKTGQSYFLPSESEWEYAAGAQADTAWHTGDAIITDDANFLARIGKTVPVASFPPNAFGLHDMHGNVAEWVSDCYDPAGYFGAPADGGVNVTPACAERVQRGGSWADEPARLRSAARQGGNPILRSPKVGFRVARAL